jgi:hypothetical protein
LSSFFEKILLFCDHYGCQCGVRCEPRGGAGGRQRAQKSGRFGPDLDGGGPDHPKAATPISVAVSTAAAVVVDEAPVAKGGKRGGFKGKAAAKAAAALTTPKAATPKAAAPTSEERSRRTPTPSAKVLAALADAVVVSPVLVAVREKTLPPPEIVRALT